MALFLSDEEFEKLSGNAVAVREKAESLIRDLHNQLESTRAHAESASITSEQAFSLVEHKYLSLSSDFTNIHTDNQHINTLLHHRLTELALSRDENHKLHLISVERDGQIERLSTEVSELHKSKRQLLRLLEDKDSVIGEKDATIKSYLDKIVQLVDDGVMRDSKLRDIESEVSRARTSILCVSQEKELIQKHNSWLNDELTTKVKSILDIRKSHSQHDAEMSTKLDEAERQLNECSNSLKWNKDRVQELEEKLSSLQNELCSSKEAAAVSEAQLSAEVDTLNKLVELYKESSEEWSKKAIDLEGVIKALEMHLKQTENEYKQTIEKESSLRNEFQKESLDLKEKLDKCQSELENFTKETEANILPLRSISSESWARQVEASGDGGSDLALVPHITAGLSGTAIAASLLRDGWSLAKMYSKYQEAIDAFRHEELGRKHAQAVLEQVLSEIEEKAALILDDRAEHEKMAVAYSSLSRKLHDAISEHTKLENIILLLKADVRRTERDYSVAQKEISDLQMQVSVLLKECRDVQLRCGSDGPDDSNIGEVVPSCEISENSDVDKVISGRLLTFKDIRQLVEQNVQLRSLVRSLSSQIENRELEYAQKIKLEIEKHNSEAGSKVSAVLERAAEQARMIDSLHNSVAMYKKLYEEEHKIQESAQKPEVVRAEPEKSSPMLLLESSKESTKRAEERASARLRCMEEELAKYKGEITSLRLERDKMELEGKFSQERFDRLVKEIDHQRSETNGILGRNVELSSLIVDYQRKLRENSDILHTAEEHSKKLMMEMSFFKHEKDLLVSSAKRDSEEASSLRERVYRLQATLDTINATEETREEARSIERKRQDEHVKHIEREWAEAKKELHDQRDIVRTLTLDRENTMQIAMKKVEDVNKEMVKSLHVVASSEARAAAAEARFTELEKKLKTDVGVVDDRLENFASQSRFNEVNKDQLTAYDQVNKDQFEELKLIAQTNKDHMEQYKNIALVNEAALKQMELSHENFKSEAEKINKSMEDEVSVLRIRTSELEVLLEQKYKEISSTVSEKEEALSSSLNEIVALKEENSVKVSHISKLEIQIAVLKDDLDKERLRFRAAQGNYERQVVLQSETIQELAKTSDALASLQEESLRFRKLADSYETECNDLKVRWENEKVLRDKTMHEADINIAEINEQNKILHCRVEALHIKLGERDCSAAGLSFQSIPSEDDDSGLQNVINYLRRSKEIAETEISLLKQEKNRLQSQLESSLKSAEEAHTTLVSHRENSRAMLFTEEEMKSLQLQVNEMNLLRESNTQLREENKHNFQECQKLLEDSHKYRLDIDNLELLLKKKEKEIDTLQKEMEALSIEKDNMKIQISELNDRCKDIDVKEYGRLKVEAENLQESLRRKDVEMEQTNNLIQNKNDNIAQLELDLIKCRQELGEREESLSDIAKTEANKNSDIEKKKKVISHLKNKIGTLSCEKEELGKENCALVKQLEDSKKQGEQEKEGEKETRIHILERTLEKHREDLRREKSDHQMERENRITVENSFADAYRNVSQEKSRLDEEFEKHRQVVKRISDEVATKTDIHGFFPNNMLDDLPTPYALAFEKFEKIALSYQNNVSSDLPTAHAPEGSAMDVSPATFTALNLPPVGRLEEEKEEEREKGKSLTRSSSPIKPAAAEAARQAVEKKPGSETRRMGRKLIRPRLGRSEEPPADMEAADGGDGSVSETATTLRAASLSQHRKRVAPHSSSSSDAFKESKNLVGGEPGPDAAPPLQKKSKGLEKDAPDLSIPLEPPPEMPPVDLPSATVSPSPETTEIISFQPVSEANEMPTSVQFVSGTGEISHSEEMVVEMNETPMYVQFVEASSIQIVSATNEMPPSVQLVSVTNDTQASDRSVSENIEMQTSVTRLVCGTSETPPSVPGTNEPQTSLQLISTTDETPPSVQTDSESLQPAEIPQMESEPDVGAEAEAEGERKERKTETESAALGESVDKPSPQDVYIDVDVEREEGEMVEVAGMDIEEDQHSIPGVTVLEDEEEEEEEGEVVGEVDTEEEDDEEEEDGEGEVDEKEEEGKNEKRGVEGENNVSSPLTPNSTPDREDGKQSPPTSSNTINITQRARQRALLRQAGATSPQTTSSTSTRLNYRGGRRSSRGTRGRPS